MVEEIDLKLRTISLQGGEDDAATINVSVLTVYKSFPHVNESERRDLYIPKYNSFDENYQEKIACLVEVVCMHSSWLHGTDQAKKGRLHACMPVCQGNKLLGRQCTRDSYEYESLSDEANSFSEIPRAPAQILRQKIWEANTYILIRRKSKIASVVKNRNRNYYYFC